MKNPIFLLWTVICVGALAIANFRGWSLLHALSPARLFSDSSPGFHHK